MRALAVSGAMGLEEDQDSFWEEKPSVMKSLHSSQGTKASSFLCTNEQMTWFPLGFLVRTLVLGMQKSVQSWDMLHMTW